MDDYIENMETWLDSRKFLISNTELTMSCISIFQVVAQMMWLMDHIFKYTNFGIVSLIHGDFFIRQVGDAHWDGGPECPLWQKTRQNCWAKRAQFSGLGRFLRISLWMCMIQHLLLLCFSSPSTVVGLSEVNHAKRPKQCLLLSHEHFILDADSV